jgi:hypothetical protein
MNDTKIHDQVAIGAGVVFVLIFAIIFYVITREKPDELPTVEKEVVEFRTALQESVSGNDPEPLQEYFADKVAAGENDMEAKSAIYWITHRYFDNGGDIKEIYDFVNAHPEVAFLKEAESKHPIIFAKVADGTIEKYGTESLLALMAYYDVIDSYGYGDIALWGIAANQHTALAFIAERTHSADPTKEYPEGTDPLSAQGRMIERAFHYTERAQEYLLQNTQTTRTLDDLDSVDAVPDDILVGLNQYGAALEALEGLGFKRDPVYTPDEIYVYTYKLVSTKVPRLYFFTNFLYASSLVVGGRATAENVTLPLSRAIEYAETTDPTEWRSSVLRVTNARIDKNGGGMYAIDTIKSLASLNVEFKNWLMKNGWTEADFM